MAVAELNIAYPRFALDDERIAPFMKALDAVNAIAERSEGFIWRFTGEGNNATDIVLAEEPDAIVNMSVWRDVDCLQGFVWTTVHRRFFERKYEWFDMRESRDFVMWQVADDHVPTVAEGYLKLKRLRLTGSTDEAFGWDHVSPKRWLGKVRDEKVETEA